jgi:CheY-like chemotaxis protein
MKTELILVDDDPVLLVMLQKMFSIVDPDLQLSPFHSGKEALAYLSGNHDTAYQKFILLDINLRDMSAWQFMNEFENVRKTCPSVILITSSVASANAEKAKNYAPVVGFFEKPITFQNIEQILKLVGKH